MEKIDTNKENNPDVLVIGGGPAGATCAALLAQQGIKVTVAEKSKHPRFHIGESLLPMNMTLFERLGIRDQVEAIGERKNGLDFSSANQLGYTASSFKQAGKGIPEYALQVRRDQFDQLLFNHAQTQGAVGLEETTVQAVDFACSPPVVTLRDKTNSTYQMRPKFVVDASGRDALMASRNSWKKPNRRHSSAAIYGHFKNVARRRGQLQGNISIVYFDYGWIWLIPLPDGNMSIGATCRPDYLKMRKGELESFLWQTLLSVPAIAARMKKAELVGKVQVAANYSYSASKTWGDDFAIIGDAAAFVDPVLSSGVYFAMHNAETTCAIITKKLAGDLAGYRRASRRNDRLNRRSMAAYCWFIYRFNTPALRFLFQNPRNIFGLQSAVMSVLAGDVFGSSKNIRKIWLFKILYWISSAVLRFKPQPQQQIGNTTSPNMQQST